MPAETRKLTPFEQFPAMLYISLMRTHTVLSYV